VKARPEQLLPALGEWRSAPGPLFLRLAHALARAGEQGELPGTGELPAERALAGELAVSRATVTAAYAELRRLGLATTRHGSGTIMRNALPPATGAPWPSVAGLLAREGDPGSVIDLTVGAPYLDEIVGSLALPAGALASHVDGHGYAPLGWAALRARIAAHLSRRGGPTTPEEVLVTNGAQEAISLAVGLVAGAGRQIAVESPGYPGALDAVARAGGRSIGVARDAGGLRVDELKRLLAASHVHALYVAPSCNNPTGGRTAEHRRQQLASLAGEHEITIIEDNVLEELNYAEEPGSPIWALAPERVLVAGSLSKVAWGGLSVGWLRAPRRIVLRLARVRGALNRGAGAFDQLAALELVDNYQALSRHRRRQAAAHMEALVAALRRELPDWSIEPVEGGWSLWIILPAGSASTFVSTALRHGVAIAAGGANSPDEAFPECVRICFALPPPVLDEAARRLSRAWSEFVSSTGPVTTLARS
jgi:DNA-binding transcriptional MocR family regulator